MILGGSNAHEYIHHTYLEFSFQALNSFTLCALIPPILDEEEGKLAAHLEKSRRVMESHGLH